MEISDKELYKIISEETDKVWNIKPEEDLIAFVQNQIESVSQPLTQDQLTALTYALTYVTKATTKSTLIAWANVQGRLQSGQK